MSHNIIAHVCSCVFVIDLWKVIQVEFDLKGNLLAVGHAYKFSSSVFSLGIIYIFGL